MLYLTNDEKQAATYTLKDWTGIETGVWLAPRVAERIEALAEPEAKWDQDTYGMKQGGTRPRAEAWTYVS